jgi:hypothetical protein
MVVPSGTRTTVGAKLQVSIRMTVASPSVLGAAVAGDVATTTGAGDERRGRGED